MGVHEIDVGERHRAGGAERVVAAAVVSASSVTVPAWAELVMVGSSLVPVMVTVTVCCAVPPWPSSTVTT